MATSRSAAITLSQQLLQPHPSTSCQTDQLPQSREPERIHTHAGYYMNPVSKVGVQSHIPRSQFTMSTTAATTASTMRNNGGNPATTATTTTQRVGMQPTESYYAHPKTSHLSFYQRPLNSLANATADGVPHPPHFSVATSIQPYIPQQNPNDSKGSTISHNPYILKQHPYISQTNQYPRNYQNPSSDNSTTTTTSEKAATQYSVEQPCTVAERVRILGSNYDHKEMKITAAKYDYAYFESKYQELTCKENNEPNIPSKSPEFMRSANHPNRKANQLEQLQNGIDSTASVAATSTTSTHSNKFSQNYPFQARNNYNQNVHLLNGDDCKSQSTSRFIQTREQYSTVPVIATADDSDISSDEIAKHFRSRNQLSGITASTETNSNSQNIKPTNNNYSFNSSNPLQSKTPSAIDRQCFNSKQLEHINPKWFMHHHPSEPVAPAVAAAATQSGATKVQNTTTTTTSVRVTESKRSNSILLDPCNNEQSSYFLSSCSYTRGILQHPPSYIPESTSTTSKKTSIAKESDFLGFNCNTSRPSSNSRSSHTLKHSRTNENLFEPVVVVAITNNIHSNDSQSIPRHGSNAQRNSAASACSQAQANCLDNKRDARSISNATHNIPTSSSSSTTRDSSMCRNIQVIPTNQYRNSKEEIELPPHMSYVRTRQLTQNLLIHRPNSEGDSDTLFVSNNQSSSTRTIASSAAPISNALQAFNAKPKNSIIPDEESLQIRQASQNPTPQTGRESSVNNFQIAENKSRTHQFQTNISSNSLMNRYQYPTQTRSERSKSEISIVQRQKPVESSTSNYNIAIQKFQQDQPPYNVSTSSHQKNQSIQQEKSSKYSYLPLKSKEHHLNFSFSNSSSEPTFSKIESQPRNDRIQNPEDHYDIPTLIDPPKKEQFRTEPTTNINNNFVELNCVENQSKIEELADQVSFLIQKEDKEFDVKIKEQNVQREYMHDLKRLQSQEQKLRDNTSQKSHGCERLSRNSRYILLDWMLRQSVKFSFMRETIHKAFVYLDRFISAVPTYQQEDLFHIALACIMLAAKHEELCPPSIEKFIKNSCFQGDLTAIKKHERILVEKLRWELNVVTPVYWLSIAQFYWDSSHSLSGKRSHSTQSAAPTTTTSSNSPGSRDNMIGVVFREKNNLESYEFFRNSYQLLDAAVMDMKICKNYKSREIALAVMIATLEKKAPRQMSNNTNKSSSDERHLTKKLDLTHICTFFHTSETFIRTCIDDLKEIDIAIAYDVKPPVKNIKELNRYPEELAYLQWNSYEDYLSIQTYPKSNQTLSALFNNC